jgi:ketosteroid isomerase-like protein
MASAALSAVDRSATEDQGDIIALVEGMLWANHDKDADAFAAPFAGDAAVFNLTPPLVHDGIDLEVRRAWYDRWATPVDLESRDLRVTVSGDVTFCHGYLRMRGTKKGTKAAVDFWMRETLCLERICGAWKIVHEHTSVPFYMDASLLPAFDLEP